MELTTSIRRIASAAAAVGVLALATAVPAVAVPDPGPPVPSTASASRNAFGPENETIVQKGDGVSDYVQIGVGAAGGLALAGAFAALGARRRGTRVVNRPA